MKYLLAPEPKLVHRKDRLTTACEVVLSRPASAGEAKVKGLLKDGWRRCPYCA